MNYRYLFLLPFLLFTTCKTPTGTAAAAAATSWVKEGEVTTYVGTYTRPEGHVNGVAEGIYRIGIDPRTGKMGSKTAVSSTINPSFLRLSENKQTLYAVSELAHADEPTGFIHAYRTGGEDLVEISKLPTNGQAPCHVEIDKTGKFVIASNYVGGAATVYRTGSDGSLLEASTWSVPQEILGGKPSWLHSANFSPDNKIVALVDKGADRVWLLSLDRSSGELEYHPQKFLLFDDGDGPRHAQWSANGRHLYVINELSNTVKVIGYDRTANRFKILQTISTLPDNFSDVSYCADLHLHPSGKFLYGSNRGHNSIAMFRIDENTGRLTSLGQESTRGEYPRNFAVDSRGNFLYAANQNTDNIVSFRIGEDGTLAFTGTDFKVETPVCVEW